MNPISEVINQVCFTRHLTIYYGYEYARISDQVNEADVYRVSEDLWEVDDGERITTVNEIALVEFLSRGLSWE